MKPLPEVGMNQARDPATGEMLRPNIEHRIVEGTELAAASLADLGIPAYDIVRVTSGNREGFFLLAGDREGDL
jgi:adenylyltransferase/sulfurtransferase